MKRYKKLQNQQGMTIIELLVSLVILTILFTGAMQFFPQSYSYTRVNQSKTTGVNVARNALQYMQGQSFLTVKKELVEDKKIVRLYVYDPPSSTNEGEDANDVNPSYLYQDQNIGQPANYKNISINNISYKVTIQYNESSSSSYRSSIIPIKIDVSWKRNNIDLKTNIEGDIVSEDIRESNQ
ncbi:type IV pilus modification PilV family protein [Priestia koreensis]|uniref:type IV pilus modification PilV family protein n=1 Tax=Priestia koreensis TaxID=284581 RepID=UPI00203FEA83|nr:type II secretion system protein [Priestia koreensis]MCM3002662.1 type II secretion system GspH family protein [Priestia koreensis]